MLGFIVAIFVGIICVVLGISNAKGNISSLHSYHRNRVTEENRIPFGKMVGMGTIIIGISVIIMGILSIVSTVTGAEIFTLIGTGVMIVGLVSGMIISFRAMIKYNGGIF